MAPKSGEFPAFGGLELRRDPQQVGPGAALDMSNVTIDTDGVVKTRDGMSSVATLAAVAQGMFVWPTPSLGNDLLIIPTASNIYAYSTDGTNRGSTATASTYRDFVAMGVGGTEGYLARGASSIQKISFFGVLTSPAGMPQANCLAVQTPDNRLVAGDVSIGGARIRFSDPGAPETFGVNNWVDLEPNDGDQLTSLVSWNNLIFAFKTNKLYVFYGNDTSSTGTPVFNYRRVSGDLGAVVTSGSVRNAIAMPDGVYFVHRSGVYKTTGSQPVKVSSQLDPLFRGWATNPYYAGPSGSSFEPRLAGLARIGNRLVLRSSSSSWFVYDMDRDFWMYWSVPGISGLHLVSAVGPDSSSTIERLYHTNSTSLLRITPNATTDNGTAITSRYRTGFWHPGTPGAESWIREVLLQGSGTVTVKRAVNDAVTLDAGQAVTLGTAPAIAQGRDRRGLRGRNVSWEFSGTGPWSLSSVVPIVWSQRQTGEQA